MKNQKGVGNVILVVIIAVVVIAVAGGTWYAVTQNENTNTATNKNVATKNTNTVVKNTNSNSNINTNTNTNTTNTNTAVPSNWETYTNDTYNYSIQYPATWTVSNTLGEGKIQILPPDTAEKGTLELGPQLWIMHNDKISTRGELTNDGVEMTNCVANTRKEKINDQAVTRQDENCMATYDTIYFTAREGFISVGWPDVFADNYSEYEQMLNTFELL